MKDPRLPLDPKDYPEDIFTEDTRSQRHVLASALASAAHRAHAKASDLGRDVAQRVVAGWIEAREKGPKIRSKFSPELDSLRDRLARVFTACIEVGQHDGRLDAEREREPSAIDVSMPNRADRPHIPGPLPKPELGAPVLVYCDDIGALLERFRIDRSRSNYDRNSERSDTDQLSLVAEKLLACVRELDRRSHAPSVPQVLERLSKRLERLEGHFTP